MNIEKLFEKKAEIDEGIWAYFDTNQELLEEVVFDWPELTDFTKVYWNYDEDKEKVYWNFDQGHLDPDDGWEETSRYSHVIVKDNYTMFVVYCGVYNVWQAAIFDNKKVISFDED